MTTQMEDLSKESSAKPQHRKAVRALCEMIARFWNSADTVDAADAAVHIVALTFYCKQMGGLRIGKISVETREGVAHCSRYKLFDAVLILAAENFLSTYNPDLEDQAAAESVLDPAAYATFGEAVNSFKLSERMTRNTSMRVGFIKGVKCPRPGPFKMEEFKIEEVVETSPACSS